jgi:hypothetical protein
MIREKAVGQMSAYRAARAIRHGRGAVATLMMLVFSGCGPSDAGMSPQVTGSMSVTTETSGFQQDDSYDLLVDGVSVGTIGANDELMLDELDPATYEVALGDVANNCTGGSVLTATVVSAQTAAASLSVSCAPTELVPYSLRANRDRPNLEDGTITECTFGLCPTNEGWDLFVEFDSQSDPQATVRQNQFTGVELAHLPGKTLATLTEADVESAVFTTDPVDTSFDSGRVILVRTDTGSVYALANPVENTILLTVTFDVVLLLAG